MKGKIQLINHQGDIARPLKIINGEFNTKMLKLKKKYLQVQNLSVCGS